MKNIKVKINKQILSHKPGSEVRVLVDENDTPIESFWRRRFKDSETDGCLEIPKKESCKKDDVKPKEVLKSVEEDLK